MKLIVQGLQELSVELIDPEISIVDKSDPSRTYVISPSGGYIIISGDERFGLFNVEMKTNIEIIGINIDPEFISRYVLGKSE